MCGVINGSFKSKMLRSGKKRLECARPNREITLKWNAVSSNTIQFNFVAK